MHRKSVSFGHISIDCPKKRSKDKDKGADKSKTKEADKWDKKKPSAGLVPNMTGKIPIGESSQLLKAWGKVRDQTALIFFDPGTKVNFISSDLASKLGVKPEEMGSLHKARMAAPRLAVPNTPIIVKLRIHVQNYVDAEEFFNAIGWV